MCARRGDTLSKLIQHLPTTVSNKTDVTIDVQFHSRTFEALLSRHTWMHVHHAAGHEQEEQLRTHGAVRLASILLIVSCTSREWPMHFMSTYKFVLVCYLAVLSDAL